MLDIASTARVRTSSPRSAAAAAAPIDTTLALAPSEVDFTLEVICSIAAAVSSSVAAWFSVRCDSRSAFSLISPASLSMLRALSRSSETTPARESTVALKSRRSAS